VDAAIDCVGFEARGHGRDGKGDRRRSSTGHEHHPASASGLYVTDILAVSTNSANGNLSIRIGLGWAKSLVFATGQCPVLRYNRQLMMAIL
jgi:glutathione-independent formaldehyde dehydrogenase